MIRRENVTRRVVDGVPVYHARTSGQVHAALMFRVGRGDETAATSGISHLVEHLALFRFGQRPFEYNGAVDPLRTLFVAAGNATEVARFLGEVCTHLGDLPLERLSTEQRVLRDEASRRSPSPPDHHGWLRWGLHGPGLAFVPEFGLWRITPDEVMAWSRSWFTAANAAVVWAGPKFPDLRLALPPGERRPAVAPADLLEGPVYIVGAPDHVTVSFRLQRTAAAASTQRILAKRLQQELRYKRGLSYDISMHYQPLSAEDATNTIWASCGAADAETVRNLVLETVLAMELGGPTEEELAADLDSTIRSREQPFAFQAEADRAAIQELLGATPETPAQLVDEHRAVTTESGRAAFAASMPTGILTHPQGLPEPWRWVAPYPNLVTGHIGDAHRYFDLREQPFSPRRRFPVLALGPSALGVDLPDGTGMAVDWDEVAALVATDDSTLAVIHDSGTELQLHPAQWHDALEIESKLLAAVPPDRQVVMTSDGVRRAWAQAMPTGRTPLILSVVGSLLIVAGAANFFDPPRLVPISAGALATLAGSAYVAAAGVLIALMYAARRYKPWSWIAALAYAGVALIALAIGAAAGGIVEGIGPVIVVPFALAHLWKVRLSPAARLAAAATPPAVEPAVGGVG